MIKWFKKNTTVSKQEENYIRVKNTMVTLELRLHMDLSTFRGGSQWTVSVGVGVASYFFLKFLG